MPGRDGTGPMGKGPGSGWGRGNCTGNNRSRRFLGRTRNTGNLGNRGLGPRGGRQGIFRTISDNK